MSYKGRVRPCAIFLALAVAPAAGWSQVQPRADWRKVGPPAVELMLASPATGPVDRVWFSASGSVLYIRTHSGKTLQTADMEAWTAAPDTVVPPPPPPAEAVRLPEAGASVVAVAGDASLFALHRNLYQSRDGGRSWRNLTALKTRSVIGFGQRAVAVSPRNPDQIVAANDYGVWSTMDGGLTWSGLNQSLPNLPVRRILSTPTGTAGTRIRVEGLPNALELPPGGAIWVPLPDPNLDNETFQKERLSAALGAEITAFATAGQTIYAGSGDGRMWTSTDAGASFQPAPPPSGPAGRIERIWTDPAQPRVALAALSGAGAHVLRTFNSGAFWDPIDSGLPDAPAMAVTADLAAGAVYAATARGVFWASMDLLTAGSAPRWTAMSGGLPAEPVMDVRLDPAGVQVYVAVEGYGVYAAPAPHRRRSVKIISAADFSSRPAAPGSLLSVVGAHVNSARGGNLNYTVLGLPNDAESQIQVPFGATGASVSLALDTAAGAITLPLQLQPVSPAIFVARDGAPSLFDADSGQPIDSRSPARSNGRIQILAAGLGRVQPEWQAGMATPLQNPPAVAAQVKVFLDGVPLEVTRATLAPGYIGFYVVEAQLPVIANFGSSQLWLSADGEESNRVALVIEP